MEHEIDQCYANVSFHFLDPTVTMIKPVMTKYVTVYD